MMNLLLAFQTTEPYSEWIEDTLIDLGVAQRIAEGINILVYLLVYLIFLFIVSYLLLKIFPKLIKAISKRRKGNFQKYLIGTGFSKYLAYIIPLLIISNLTSNLLIPQPTISKIIAVLVNIILSILLILFVGSMLKGLENYLRTKPQLKDKPLQSYTQVLTIFVWGIGIMATINYVAGGNLITLGALGAGSAVLMLVFRDMILGFVASIQISVSDIVRIGDWIELDSYGADGFVTNISLVTVTIQNWDKTYSNVPTYSLISGSFKNWRGIYDTGGRRIKRSIYIKQNSIRFMNEADLNRLRKIERVKHYIDHRQLDIDRSNKLINADKSVVVNGRNQTNIGIFRKYVDAFLKEHTGLNFDLLCLARTLQPTEHGVPLEVYCFTKQTTFVEHEAIQGFILDHITATASHFGLEIYEAPSGRDIEKLAKHS